MTKNSPERSLLNAGGKTNLIRMSSYDEIRHHFRAIAIQAIFEEQPPLTIVKIQNKISSIFNILSQFLKYYLQCVRKCNSNRAPSHLSLRVQHFAKRCHHQLIQNFRLVSSDANLFSLKMKKKKKMHRVSLHNLYVFHLTA